MVKYIEKRNAQCIKAELIDYLLQSMEYDLLACEVPFLHSKRRADIIAIRNNITIGFEIKSEFDSLTGLREQLRDYEQVFNFVYLVVADKFKNNKELLNISNKIGLIFITTNGFKIRRIANKKTYLQKQKLIGLLWRVDLEKLVPQKRNLPFDELKEIIIKNCSVKSIQKQVVISLINRYKEPYTLFLKDRGNYTTLEDLNIITRLKKIPVL